MALGPRLDLRQTQSLVMTPQLRQAIKLLQSSNLEVAAFVEEELERNPLLERDEQFAHFRRGPAHRRHGSTSARPSRPPPHAPPAPAGPRLSDDVTRGGRR